MNTLERFRKIHTFIFDVDGVFTDNSLLVLENGHLLRTMSARDGYAVRQAILQNYRVVIITGGRSAGVKDRLMALGIEDYFDAVHNKLKVFEEYAAKHNLELEGVMYMGDDIPDYEVMRRVGLPACPQDAVQEVKSISQYICAKKGGAGCVREIIEKVMKLHDHWPLQETVRSTLES